MIKPSILQKQHNNVNKIRAAILTHENHLDVEGNEIYSLITCICSQKLCAVPHIMNPDEVGQRLYENVVAERIHGEVSPWAPI